MKKSRFTETQIVSMLKQADAGVPVKDLCRQAGVSTATYYQWKSKYGGMEASDLKRVRELEAENAKLKRMYAELALDNAAMKDLIAKKKSRAGAEARGGALPDAGARASAAPVLQMRETVTGRVVSTTTGLDRARRGGDRRVGEVGRGASQPWFLEMLFTAAQEPSVEPQAHLSRVQGYATEPAARSEATAAQARTCAALRAEAAGQRVVGRFHGRRSGLWPAIPDLQCGG